MAKRVGHGVIALALRLQEAQDSGDSLSANDIRTRLSDAIREACRGTDNWCYYLDHFGDAESGKVIYSSSDDTKRAPYKISAGNGADAATCVIDTAKAEDVIPRVTYEVEGKESAAPEIDIDALTHQLREAGKRHSASDVKLIQSVHDTTNQLGAACPDTFRMAGQESAASEDGDTIKLMESMPFAADISIVEAITPGKKIKLIAPGKGSSAYYTVEALKQAVTDKIFKAGTPMRIDHPTAAEESARPEGSVKDWGAVLKEDAYWLDSYADKSGNEQGPGLYSEIKPFSDHAQTIEEKGPYAGVSIHANGSAVTEAGKPVMREGVPVLKKFVSAEGVDMVTRAGAGGLFLQESARTAEPTQQQEVSGMDADELKALKESNARLMERAVYQDAVILSRKLLEDVSIHESAKVMVTENVIGTEGAWKFLPRKDGALDSVKFADMINTEAKRVGKMLAQATGGGRPVGMGIAQFDAPKPEEIAARESRRKAEDAEALEVFESLMGPGDAAKAAARGRAA